MTSGKIFLVTFALFATQASLLFGSQVLRYCLCSVH